MKVVNSPAQTYSVSNPGPLVMSGLTIDNCKQLPFVIKPENNNPSHLAAQGDLPNSNSAGQPAGHNTDGFDCSTTDLVGPFHDIRSGKLD